MKAHYNSPKLAGNSKKSPINLLCLRPGGSWIPTPQLSIKSNPPLCKCTYPCAPSTPPDRYAFCAPRTRGIYTPRHRFIIFHVSWLHWHWHPHHIRPSPFLNAFPPLPFVHSHAHSFSILKTASVAFYQVCIYLQVMGGPLPRALVIVRRVGQIKVSPITSTWFLSSNKSDFYPQTNLVVIRKQISILSSEKLEF